MLAVTATVQAPHSIREPGTKRSAQLLPSGRSSGGTGATETCNAFKVPSPSRVEDAEGLVEHSPVWIRFRVARTELGSSAVIADHLVVFNWGNFTEIGTD